MGCEDAIIAVLDAIAIATKKRAKTVNDVLKIIDEAQALLREQRAQKVIQELLL